jgi:hypothetical protein
MQESANAGAVEETASTLAAFDAHTGGTDFAFGSQYVERAAAEVEQGAAGVVVGKLWRRVRRSRVRV